MDQISIRDLRQNASKWLHRVQGGDTFEITDRGRPVALLVPLPRGSVVEELIRAGRITPAKRNLLDLGPPLPSQPGVPLPSEILEQLRADER
jgi:prevent-host-death family protein